MTQGHIFICLRVQRIGTKVGSTATVVTNSVLIISHITFRDFACKTLSQDARYVKAYRDEIDALKLKV